ncbi:MAG TPA: hypothetical protein VL860_02500 [Planctomycetota bacterium]|nr:hypothetical protein [Planctomycetota bacterium]
MVPKIGLNGVLFALLVAVVGLNALTLVATRSEAASGQPARSTAADAGGAAGGAPVAPVAPIDDKTALENDLKSLAVLAGPLMDGDECHAVLTKRSYETMWAIDPRDQWAAMDNYDYDEDIAIRVKKQLIRLARTRGYKADCNLWLDCPEKKNTVQCVIKNVNNCCPYAPWGALYQDTPAVIQQALKGEVSCGSTDGNWVSAFAPIKNSMGDIVGVVECSSRVEYYKARVAK